MGDPLSSTAGVLATVSFASQSYKVLYKVFVAVREAASEIEHYVPILEGLQSTFISISNLEKHSVEDCALMTPAFRSSLHDCLRDLRAAQNLVKPAALLLEKEGRTKRFLAKLRWTASQRRKLDLLLQKIESHHKLFTLELSLLNV